MPGAAVAADRCGIPGLWHGFGRLIPDGIGLALPTTVVPGRPHIDICPPSLQDKDFLATEARVELRPVPYAAPEGTPRRSNGRRPLIYLTLGTAFGTPEVLTAAIAGLAPLAAQVVVAAGRVPAAELGDLPDNVAVETWVAQADLLPHADVVVHHGGSGTTLGALAAGVPQLVLPQGADQFANAEALCAAGAALQLLPAEVTADAVCERARRLLSKAGDGSHLDAARAIADEITAMPSPAQVARRLPDYA